MKFSNFFLLTFLLSISNLSIAQNNPSNKIVPLSPEYIGVRKALDSLVRVVVHDKWGLKVHEDLGFITKDGSGTIGVLTSFRIIDRALDTNTGKSSIGVYNNTNQFFPLREIGQISPADSLIFLKLEGDLTEQGQRASLPLAESFKENEPLFYITWKMDDSSTIMQFKTERVQDTINLPDRQDFIIASNFIEISPKESSNSLILNPRGEVVSFVSGGTLYTLFGTPSEKLKKFLSGPSENCSLSFLKGCLIRARRTLYKEAKSGNNRAGYEISLPFLHEELFEMFMRSIGITDALQIKKDREFFLERSAEWDGGPYFYWIVDSEIMKKKKQREHLMSLEQISKTLAEQGHPHFQHLLTLIHLQLQDSAETMMYWGERAIQKKYIPALFLTGSLYLMRSVGELKKLARENHIPASQLLGLLHHDFSNATDFLEEYTDYKPLRPSGPPRKRSSFQSIQGIFFRNILSTQMEWSLYEQNNTFSSSLKDLERGLNLLNESADGGFNDAKELLNNFEQRMALARNPEEPIYIPSPLQELKCREMFAEHFTSSKE